jgi:hypothetical protein
VHEAGQLDVVEVGRLPAQDALVLAPRERLPDETGGLYSRSHLTR